ncbi:MAG: hypothetical protein V7609_1645 [Verrucomicrobiota bacterium]
MNSQGLKGNLVGALGAGLVVVVFCLALLWHDPLLFWNDDYELSILPVFADVARSWSEGHLPLLSPYSWVCGNLAGEFQYGTFSVFVNAAVVLIWKFPLSFPQQAAALSMTHLFILAMGGYMLGRGRNLSAPLASMVALVAALNGWIICWGATDWFGALGAFAWFPWAWWAFERSLDQNRSRYRFLWPAPFVYLLVTGGFPYTVLMLALVAGWLALKSIAQTRKLSSIWPLGIGLLVGLGLSAPAWLAVFDYVQGSAREAGEHASHFQWLVPLRALPGFILPSWTVNWIDFSSRSMPHVATELACGLVPPAALLAGFIIFRRALFERIKWEFGLLVAVLIISMLPSANVFRWSFRWLPFLHVVLALCAAESLHLFASSKTAVLKRPGVIGFILLFIAVVAAAVSGANGNHASPFVWIALGIGAVWALLEIFPILQTWTPASVTAASLLATYLCLSPNCGVPKYNLSQQLIRPSPLDPQRLYLSVYPQPEDAYRVEKNAGPAGGVVRPGSTSMWSGVPFINGYSPIRPAGVAREFNFGTHGEIDFAVAKRLIESEGGADGEMARLGIDGVIVAHEIYLTPPADEWESVYSSGEGAVYHRRGPPLPRMRSVSKIDLRPNEQFATADLSRIVNGRNRLQADVAVPASGQPALLTISRPFFHAYQATLGDKSLKVNSYRGLIPIIEVPAGTSGRLTVVYRPTWLLWGRDIGALSLLVMAAGVIGAVLSKRRPQSG